MAKQSFKDMIFKLLRKDENLGAYGGVKQNKPKSFKVKFAMKDRPNNIAVMSYQFEKDAEKFKKDILAKGGKAILTKEDAPVNEILNPKLGDKVKHKFKDVMYDAEISGIMSKSSNIQLRLTSNGPNKGKVITVQRDKIKEDAPANATGTAVVGTGDDSSTVVVKKKKRLQDKLMRRMGIQETIDRVIPDLEYPKDEIRERTNQLKDLASKSKDKRAPIYKQQAKNIAKAAKIPHNFNKKEDTIDETPQGYALVQKAKDIAKKMSGNMNAAVKEIEKLEKGLSNNSSVKDALQKANEELSEGERALARDKKTDQPKKYVSGLSGKDKEAHDRHLKKQNKKSDDDKSAYKQSPADKKAKTRPSKHTNKFKQMYGEDYLNEKIKGIENKAKKSGMPYSILKKVYDRGMAAWKGGHRPGTTPQQWAFARVNSFTTKSSGTWGKADSDLAKQVRGS